MMHYFGITRVGGSKTTLQHGSSPLKGSERSGHKYLFRKMGKNGKWQYIYESKGVRVKSKPKNNGDDDDGDQPKVSQEYLDELEYNSKKNQYHNKNNQYDSEDAAAYDKNKDDWKGAFSKADIEKARNRYNYDHPTGDKVGAFTKTQLDKAREDWNKSHKDSIPYVSQEYLDEVEYNSKKNKY